MIDYFRKTIDVIEDALESMEDNAFNLLVKHANKVLHLDGKIIVTGLGKNVPICEKFVGTMNSLGLSSIFLHTNSAVHGDLGAVKSKDLVIMLSKSGNTSESVYLINFLKEIGCETWAISFSSHGELKNRTDHALILELKEEGDEWNIMPINSSTVNLIVLQALAMRLLSINNISLDVFRKNHPGGDIGELLQKKGD